MKTVLISIAVLATLSFASFAECGDEPGAKSAPQSQPELSVTDKARHERCRRRHELMMERAAKRGQVLPVVPVAPVTPAVPVMVATAETDSVPALEAISVKAISLTYDDEKGKGVLTVEVVSGAFTSVNRYIRANIDKLVRNDAPGETAPMVPPDARLKVESITIDEDDFCEVGFRVKDVRKK